MKKQIYISPFVEVIPFAPEVMDILLKSVKLKGDVERLDGSTVIGTDWGFGGDSQEEDTPDAKSGNLWDGWDD